MHLHWFLFGLTTSNLCTHGSFLHRTLPAIYHSLFSFLLIGNWEGRYTILFDCADELTVWASLTWWVFVQAFKELDWSIHMHVRAQPHTRARIHTSTDTKTRMRAFSRWLVVKRVWMIKSPHYSIALSIIPLHCFWRVRGCVCVCKQKYICVWIFPHAFSSLYICV